MNPTPASKLSPRAQELLTRCREINAMRIRATERKEQLAHQRALKTLTHELFLRLDVENLLENLSTMPQEPRTKRQRS